MLIVDSQVHIWQAETPDRPWVSGAREQIRRTGHREAPFHYQDCIELMDAAGIHRAVVVPPSWEGARLDYALEAADAHPERFAIMARVPQDRPQEGAAQLRELATIDAVRGLRLTFHRPIDRDWIVDGTSDWIWPLAEELGISVMIYAPGSKARLGQIASRHPGLRLIIDHMGVPVGCVDEAIAPWVRETAALKAHPNISVKLSALPAHSTHPFPNFNLFRHVRQLITEMGPERCHWGADITRLMGLGLTWRDTVEQFTVHMGLAEAQLNEIMGQSLCRVLGWTERPAI